jgi:hypothetical protein
MRRLFLLSLLLAACSAGEDDTLEHSHSVELTLSGDTMASSYALEAEHYVSPPVAFDEPATRMAAMLTLTAADSPADKALEARGIDADGRPGAWVPVEVVFSEDELRVVRAELGVDAAETQIRVRRDRAPDLAVVTWTAIRPAVEEDAAADDAPDGFATSGRGLASDLAAAGILPRSAWGARAPRCGNADAPKQRMAIHHTVSARTLRGSYEGMLRQTQSYHMDGRGYCDVGYHFFVTDDGRAWEARGVDILGGHSGNYNGRNAGIVFVGCFDGSAACNNLGGRDVPQAMMAAGARVIRALSGRYGIPIDADRVKGHGEQPFQATACPGSHLRARLEELRALARNNTQPQPSASAATSASASASAGQPAVRWLGREPGAGPRRGRERVRRPLHVRPPGRRQRGAVRRRPGPVEHGHPRPRHREPGDAGRRQLRLVRAGRPRHVAHQHARPRGHDAGGAGRRQRGALRAGRPRAVGHQHGPLSTARRR